MKEKNNIIKNSNGVKKNNYQKYGSDFPPQDEKKMKIDILVNKFFKLIILIIVMVVLLAGYFLVIRDQYESLVQKRDVELVGLQDKINSLDQVSGTIFSYFDQSVEFKPAEEHLLDLALPDQFDFPSLIIQLEFLAREQGVVIESIEVSHLKPEIKDETKIGDGNVKKVHFSLVMSGADYDKFQEFLSALENSIMIFDVISVRFNARSNQIPNYNLELVTYYYEEGQNKN